MVVVVAPASPLVVMVVVVVVAPASLPEAVVVVAPPPDRVVVPPPAPPAMMVTTLPSDAVETLVVALPAEVAVGVGAVVPDALLAEPVTLVVSEPVAEVVLPPPTTTAVVEAAVVDAETVVEELLPEAAALEAAAASEDVIAYPMGAVCAGSETVAAESAEDNAEVAAGGSFSVSMSTLSMMWMTPLNRSTSGCTMRAVILPRATYWPVEFTENASVSPAVVTYSCEPSRNGE